MTWHFKRFLEWIFPSSLFLHSLFAVDIASLRAHKVCIEREREYMCWDQSSAEWVNQYVSNAGKKRAPFIENKQRKPSANGFALLMTMITSRTSLRYTVNND
jgi:hypothetical protein